MKNRKLSRIVALIVAVFMVASVASLANVSAYYGCEDDFSYIRDGAALKITGVLTKSADVTIPEAINGYPVLEITDLAFMGCDTVVNLTIPYTVKYIGERAFSTCRSLERISVSEYSPFYCDVDGVLFDKEMTTILQYPDAKQGDLYNVPAGVEVIEECAFRACDLKEINLPSTVKTISYGAFEISEKLERVTLSEGVEEIDMEAFCYCSSLKEVKLPASLRMIHKTAFLCCNSLENIEVAKDNSVFCSKDGVLFNKDVQTLVKYPAGKAQTEYAVPGSVTWINDYAFSDCANLKILTIPESVRSLGEYAFYDCTVLESVTIPQNITWLADCVFYNCTALSDVYYSGSESQWNEIEVEYGNECLQNATIHYNSKPAEPENPIVTYLLGDANSDGKVNVKDATMIQKSAASLVMLDLVQSLAADCDDNGQVNVRDATAVQKFAAGIATGFNIGEEMTK